MGYLFLAAMFYTVVKYSYELWELLRYEKKDHEESYDLRVKIGALNEEIAELKKEE